MEKLRNRIGIVEKINDVIDMMVSSGATPPITSGELPNTFISTVSNHVFTNNNVIDVPMQTTNKGIYESVSGGVRVPYKGAYIVTAKMNFQAGDRGGRAFYVVKNGNVTLWTEQVTSAVNLVERLYTTTIVLEAGDTITIKQGQANTLLTDVLGGATLEVHKI